MNIFNKITNIINNFLDYDIDDLVCFIISQEALPNPLTDEDENKYVALLDTEQHDFARATLIEHNLRLVIYIAKKFSNTNVELDDLVSIGIIGLIKAVGSFRADKNIKLATYASRCIENEILMHLRKTSKSNGNISLEAPLSQDSDGNELLLQDILADEHSVSEELEQDCEKDYLRNAIYKLHPRDRKIIELRYGLYGKDEFTQKQVADMMGISQSYISRLEKKILNNLKKSMII